MSEPADEDVDHTNQADEPSLRSAPRIIEPKPPKIPCPVTSAVPNSTRGSHMTSTRTPNPEEVRDAADAIVDAFRANDGDRYFAAFAPDASFVFHPEPTRLDTLDEYRTLWAGWIDTGWRVLECSSREQLVQASPGLAVFSHTVRTRVDNGDGTTAAYTERESIIFRVEGDRLVAVHEHLSTMPEQQPTEAVS